MGYLILFGWLIILPFLAGGFFIPHSKTMPGNTGPAGRGEGSAAAGLSFGGQWMWGQFLLWAVFQIVTVYFTLIGGKLDDVIRIYAVISAGIGAGGLLAALRVWTKEDKSALKRRCMWIKEQKVLTGIFVVLWLVQMAALLVLAVNDGDDAFYMAVAERARESGALYTANVYSFGNTELNYRYALAPFPIWIAFLSRISGVHILVIGHVVLGIVLVTMSYVIYGQIGQTLFGENIQKRMQMLILVAVLYIWGNTSSHTAESFLLLRTRQGKALVAGLVFPAMICLILKIGKTLEQHGKISLKDYLLAAAIILTGCLGSTLGGSLVILLWASALLLLAIGYRKWSLLPLGALSAVPGLVYALLYLLN